MHKLKQDIKTELKQIEQVGINGSNIEVVGKMVDILKDIGKIEKMEEEKEMRDYTYEDNYGMYNARGGRGGYNARGGYSNYEDSYGRRGVSGSGRGRYGHLDERMAERLDRIMDGADMYQYGRDRYRGGDSEERMYDGLEKLMYAICTFVESTMDFAETPQEKEIVRKHMQKLAKL